MGKRSNVISFTGAGWQTAQRDVRSITHEQFCLADAAGEWDTRHFITGMTILQYPRVVMICCALNNCTVITQVGTDIEAYFDEALYELDKVA